MSGQLVGGGRRDDRAYRALLAEHDRQNAVPAQEIALPALPATAAAVAQEIGAIEHVMRTDRRAYDRDEGMQSRLRQLYEAREAAGGSALPATHGDTGTKPAPARATDPHAALIAQHDTENAAAAAAAWGNVVSEARKNLPPDLVREWDDDRAGFDGNLRPWVETIVGVQQIIGDKATTDGMEASFRMLPDGVRAALIREMVMARPGFVKDADDEEMEAFRTLNGGNRLTRLWGGTRAAASR